MLLTSLFVFFFFNDTATTEIYTLSLHDALPICPAAGPRKVTDGRRRHDRYPVAAHHRRDRHDRRPGVRPGREDRKSTPLNSRHANISYAGFCLKKKKKNSQVSSISATRWSKQVT